MRRSAVNPSSRPRASADACCRESRGRWLRRPQRGRGGGGGERRARPDWRSRTPLLHLASGDPRRRCRCSSRNVLGSSWSSNRLRLAEVTDHVTDRPAGARRPAPLASPARPYCSRARRTIGPLGVAAGAAAGRTTPAGTLGTSSQDHQTRSRGSQRHPVLLSAVRISMGGTRSKSSAELFPCTRRCAVAACGVGAPRPAASSSCRERSQLSQTSSRTEASRA